MEKKLDGLKPGERGKVTKITGQGAVKRRLLDMGITPGTEVFMRKTAPLGDPMELNVRGYELSIRKEEAKSVIMEIEEAGV